MNRPRPYMLGRESTGHYRHAFREALALYRHLDPAEMAARSGAAFDSRSGLLHVSSFGQDITVHYPDGRVTFGNCTELPLMGWRLVILNYLTRADGTPPTGRLISYRELKDGMIFYPAFHRESIMPLARWVQGKSPGTLIRAISRLGGTPCEGADLAAILPALPRFPVTLKIWFGDEELPGSANILFDATANRYLHTEDIAVIGGYAAAFLIKEYQIMTGRPWREIVL